jgi:toxin CcdB
MHQFDIVRLKSGQLAVVLQSDLLDDRETRVVAPLFPSTLITPTPRLHPIVRLKRKTFLIATEKLAAVLVREVDGVIGSAAKHEYDIRRALDIVFIGF